MSVTLMHGLEAVKIDVNDVATGILSGTDRYRISLANELGAMATDGDLYTRFQSLHSQKITAAFDTVHIVQALDFCGFGCLRVSATGGSKTGVTLYAKKNKEGGGREAGNSHESYNVKEGILVPRRLIVPHLGDARIEYELFATWDTENDPLVVSTGVALPTNPNTPARHTLGPITLALDGVAVPFTQVRQLEIDFGHQVETVGADSDIWDTNCRIVETMPKITLRGINKTWLSNTKIPLTGAPVDHVDTLIVLRKRKRGSTFVDGWEAEHVGITACGMAVVETPFDVQGNQLGETSIMIPLEFDGTTAPLTIDTTYAYEEEP